MNLAQRLSIELARLHIAVPVHRIVEALDNMNAELVVGTKKAVSDHLANHEHLARKTMASGEW